MLANSEEASSHAATVRFRLSQRIREPSSSIPQSVCDLAMSSPSVVLRIGQLVLRAMRRGRRAGAIPPVGIIYVARLARRFAGLDDGMPAPPPCQAAIPTSELAARPSTS